MTDNSKFNFSKAIKDIEEINNWFQNEEIDVDEGLEKFRSGLELIKKCKSRLKQVENEFVEIKKEFYVEEKSVNDIETKSHGVSSEGKEVTPEDSPF